MFYITLFKSKRAMAGETRIRGDGHTYKKQGDGTWVRTPDSVKAYKGDKLKSKLKSKGHGAIIESVTTGRRHYVQHTADGDLKTTDGYHLSSDRHYKLIHEGEKKPKVKKYKNHEIRSRINYRGETYHSVHTDGQNNQAIATGKTIDEAKANLDKHYKQKKESEEFKGKFGYMPGLQVDGNWGMIELDRYRRHDHGGGSDGDDWLDSHEISKDYERGVKAYGHKLKEVNNKLKAAGYKPNAEFNLGEKGHFSINFTIQKKSRSKNSTEKSMSVLELCNDLIKAGEGSRGGKIIGHTKSGKPIYESSHKEGVLTGYSDHMDAHHSHKDMADHYAKTGDLKGVGAADKWAHHKRMATHHKDKADFALKEAEARQRAKAAERREYLREQQGMHLNLRMQDIARHHTLKTEGKSVDAQGALEVEQMKANRAKKSLSDICDDLIRKAM